MKVTGVKTHIISSRHSNSKRNWLLLRLTTDEGLEGLGEASMLDNDPLVSQLVEEWVEAVPRRQRPDAPRAPLDSSVP